LALAILVSALVLSDPARGTGDVSSGRLRPYAYDSACFCNIRQQPDTRNRGDGLDRHWAFNAVQQSGQLLRSF